MHTRSFPAKAGNDGYAGTLGTSKKKKNRSFKYLADKKGKSSFQSANKKAL